MSEQLKIAMISLHSCPLGQPGRRDTGGMNVYIRELAQELGKRGHTVDIFTRNHQPEHEKVLELAENVHLIHLETGGAEEIPKIAFYTYLQRFICETENYRSSADIHYDLIHSHYWLSGLAGKQLQAWWHVPHMVMFHTVAASKNSIGIGLDEPELRTEGEKEVAHSCERIIAATVREKEDLINYYNAPPQKITVIPCGVNQSLFKPVDKEAARRELGVDSQKIILFVGRIEPLKGLEQLIKALGLINSKEEIKLLIVGGDEDSKSEVQDLQILARELNIDDRVAFLGSVIQERLPVLYSAADVCAIPSYYETFGMVALEALACGTRVVATDVGDMRNILRYEQIGSIVSKNAPEYLADKISELLTRGDNQAQDIKARQALTAEYNWGSIADLLLQEYSDVRRSYPVAVSL